MVRGIVYKITSHLSNDKCYIGSTLNNIESRLKEHKNAYQAYVQNKCRDSSVFELFRDYGVNSCKIHVLREYEVCDRKHLYAYESLWISKTKTCINRIVPFQIKWYIRKTITPK